MAVFGGSMIFFTVCSVFHGHTYKNYLFLYNTTLYCPNPLFQTCQFRPYFEVLGVLFQWSGYLNSLVNPVLYAVFNKEYRTAMSALAGKIFCK